MQAIADIRGVLAVGLAAWLAGCTVVPSTNIKAPLTVRPEPKPVAAEGTGSIFQPGRGVALFEDRRARYIGDTLTVNLVEKTSATRKSATSESRSASAAMDIPSPTILGKNLRGLGATTWAAGSDLAHEFDDNDTNSNNVSGSVTVTVIEVLPNGNLKVAGEKQLAVNNDTDFIRLAGVVNPAHITATNTINSTQLADVQIESKNSQGLDTAQVASMLARFFLTVLPF